MAIRITLDFAVNAGFYSMIMATAPILLSVETPLDFLRDIIAFTFILRFDDLFETRDVTEMYYKELSRNDNENEYQPLQQPQIP